MSRSAFAEIFTAVDQNEIIIRSTEKDIFERFYIYLENHFPDQKPIKEHLPFQITLDAVNIQYFDLLWEILRIFCDEDWEPLGSAHHVFSAGQNINSIRIYQFKKFISDPPYLFENSGKEDQ